MSNKVKRAAALVKVFAKAVAEVGPARAMGKVRGYFRARRRRPGRFLPDAAELARQRAEKTEGPLFSVVVGLYNTPEPFLREMIDSVLGQTYRRFELCLADASADTACAKVVDSYDDGRIRYKKLEENGGIAASGNAAAALAVGDYLAFLDHDDVLSPNALYENALAIGRTGADMVYSDEALFDTDILRPIVGHFKPAFSPQYLLGSNYICHLLVVRRALFVEVGGLRSAFDGAQDHDLILRLTEKTQKIEHIAKVLYYWRQHAGSTSGGTGAKPYADDAGRRAVEEHLNRTGARGVALPGLFPSTYQVRYDPGDALVSVLIPNKDHTQDLDKALVSVFDRADYKNVQVIVIENNSTLDETFAYYEKAKARWPALQVVTYTGAFNYSAVNNFGRRWASGEYLLLLNNDVEAQNPSWLSELVGQCRQPGVGAVGAKLLYPDGTVQHGGVILGLGGYAGHSHKYAAGTAGGYMFRLAVAQELSAVTGACLLVRAVVYDALGGLDENLAVAYNDVDFCLRVRAAGWRIVYTPFARLTHFESKSRGSDEKGPAVERADRERAYLKARWGDALLHDPYYSPNLTLDEENFAENPVLPKF